MSSIQGTNMNNGFLRSQICFGCITLGLVLTTGCSSSSDSPIERVEESISQTIDAPVTDTDTDTPPTESIELTDENPVANPDPISENSDETEAESEPVNLGEGNQAIEQLALVFLAEVQGPTSLDITASSRIYRLAFPLDDLPVLRNQDAADLCEISMAASQLNAEALNFPVDHLLDSSNAQALQVTPITPGDSVEITSDAGSYASLGLLSTDDNAEPTEYTLQSGAPMNQVVPDELSFDVVGAQGPIQWQWSKPALLLPELRDAVRSIGANPVLSWQAEPQSAAVQSQVMIYAAHINELSGEFQSFECALQDDGEFTFPEDIQALFSNGFAANFVDVVRYTRTLETLSDTSVVNVFVQKL